MKLAPKFRDRLVQSVAATLLLAGMLTTHSCGSVDKNKPWQPEESTILIVPYGTDGGQVTNPTSKHSRQDIVRWTNNTSLEFILEFLGADTVDPSAPKWPFRGTPYKIVVSPGETTGWFILRDTPGKPGKHLYKYRANHPLEGPPGDPGVWAED